MKTFMRLGIAALLFVALGAVFAEAAQATTYTYLELGFSEEPEIGKKIPFTVVVKSSKPDDQIGGFADAIWFDLTEGSRVLKESDKFQKDHTYQVEIKYKCNAASDISKDAVFWINGNAAGWNKGRSMWAILNKTYRDVVVYCNISMSAQVIASVRLPDLPQVTAGEHPPYLQSGTYRDENNHCHINYGRTDLNSYYRGAEAWFDETDRIWLDEFDTFQVNHTYRYYVAVSADSGYVFDSENSIIPKVSARTLSGQENYAAEFIKADSRGVTDFAAGFLIPCKSVVSSVSVTGITEPAAGAKPDYTASASGTGYRVRKYTGQDWLDGVMWMDQTTETVLSPDSAVFKDGHTYRCYVQVLIDEAGYAFANDGTKPTVKCYLDGKEATVGYGPNDDFRSDLWLYRDYEARIPEIDSVSVTGVTWPVPGEKPVYDAQMPAGAAYELENFDNGSWYNGIYWQDVTDNETLDKDDVFRSGHTYRITVSLVGKNGAVFTKDDVSAAVNGKEAESVIRYENWNIGVTATFQCVGMTVHAVHLGIQSPEAGGSPDWNVTVTEPGAHYAIDNYTSTYWKNGVIWHDVTADKDMGEDDRFAAGHQYRVTVSVVTKDGYVFGNYQDGEVEAYLGDERADEIDAWNDPENNIGLIKTYTVTAKWLPGDANEDGKVDMLDALRVVQYVNGKTGVINLKNADVTGDGKAAIEDARLIGQWAAGWNVGLK